MKISNALPPQRPATGHSAHPRPPRPHPVRYGWSVLACLALAACSSTPLPPWPAQPPANQTSQISPATEKPQPGRVVPAPLGAAQPPVTVTPVQAAPSVSAPPPAIASPVASPVGAAIPPLDARFAAPAMRYDTPGLAAGRRAFTTQAELLQWLSALSRQGQAQAQLIEYGRSQRGMVLPALVLTSAGSTDVAALEASRRPTVLLLGQQHGNEPASAEALLVLARELSSGGALEPLLKAINVVIVPRANPDGAEAGLPATANGIDLDRDHLLLRTPEAQGLARLIRNYRPMSIIDLHEYPVRDLLTERTGMLAAVDLQILPASTANLPEFMTRAAIQWYHDPMVKALADAGLTQDWAFEPTDGPQGLRLLMGGTAADSARNVNGLKNAVSLLIASRGSDLDRQYLQRRVHSLVTALGSALRSTAERAAKLEEVRSYEARDIASQACRGDITVRAQGSPQQRELLAIDPQTGAERPVRAQAESTLQLRPTLKRARPCGYWLAASTGDAVQRLRWLGLQVLRVAEPGALLADMYEPQGAGERGENLRLSTRRSLIDVPAGSYYLPLNQPQANLAVAALEPDSLGSYYEHRLIGSLQETARIAANPPLVFEELD